MRLSAREILCTLGPASMDESIIRRLADLGTTLFRINLSHTQIEDLRDVLQRIAGCTDVPICLDTEGAQIRTANFSGERIISENSMIRIPLGGDAPGNPSDLVFYPAGVPRELIVGDIVRVDFDSVLLQVIERSADAILLRAIEGGRVGPNKAVALERDLPLNPITEKDKAAIEIGRAMGIRHFALSFAHRASDVDALRALAGNDAFVISKIECRAGLAHIDSIARASDALLIDRGDLSRQVPFEQLPRVQKDIIRSANAAGVKVYVATNLLETMVTSPMPTRAEINDIYNTLLDGADGLVLAAETAIGAYPVRAVGMIVKMIREVTSSAESDATYHSDPFSLLVEPHGGRLVHRVASAAEIDGLHELPTLRVNETDILDCRQIAHGTYSPLTGFMDRQTLMSVLDHNRLQDGTPWTMPILLQSTANETRRFAKGDRIALTDDGNEVRAILDVSDMYALDMSATAQRWFGTDVSDHPGVSRFTSGGNVFIGGAVTLVTKDAAPSFPFELMPYQTRFVFTHKGWIRVVGFHGRNVCHTAHEYIQKRALQETGADGLFISPVVGPKKRNDFYAEPIIRSYQLLLENGYYPKGKVVLGNFSTYSRYCGPREAVFTALCRKNMGCSHFILGRDHAGVGNFYGADANRLLFDEIGDLGIEPTFFDEIGYNPETKQYEEVKSGGAARSISGTRVREALIAGQRLPDWAIRDIVQDMLLGELAAGRRLFHE